MRRRAKALGHLVRDRWVLVLAAGVLAYVLATAVGYLQDLALATRSPESFFEYAQVEYVGVDGDVLVMESTAVWREQGGPVVWTDVLRCQPPGAEDVTAPANWWLWSSQTTSAPRTSPASDTPRVARWPYSSSFPTDGRPCVMESTISVEYGRSSLTDGNGRTVTVDVVSPVFTPGRWAG